MATTMHWAPKRSEHVATSYGSASAAVQRHLVGAELQHHPHVGVAADAAADRERDKDLVGGAPTMS